MTRANPRERVKRAVQIPLALVAFVPVIAPLPTLPIAWASAERGGNPPISTWQQGIHYHISVTLRPETHTLVGHESIRYTNNSSDTLEFIWLHVYPNAFRDRNTVFAREVREANVSTLHFAPKKDRGWMEIENLEASSGALRSAFKPGDETELQVFLDSPLAPGDSVTLDMDFSVRIPHTFSRLGRRDHHYDLTQWYPKVVVYDRNGWHPDGYHYLAGFYGAFASYDVEIALPSEMIVGATGVLASPQSEIEALESLAAIGNQIHDFYHKGMKDEADALLDSLRDSRKEKGGAASSMKTLRFVASNVHDFAWVADPDFLLQRTHLNQIEINVLSRASEWKRWRYAKEYVRNALETFESWYGDYGYPQYTMARGYHPIPKGGAEYPMLSICSASEVPLTRIFEGIVAHETAHQWFHAMLGNDELAEPWLSKGMASFSEVRLMQEKYGKDAGYTQYPDYLSFLPDVPYAFDRAFMTHLLMADGRNHPLATPRERFPDGMEYMATVYQKGSSLLFMLRDSLGDSLFLEVMRTYVDRYRFRHVTSRDFTTVAEEVSGRDLSSFFNQWLHTDRTCDYALSDFESKRNGNPESPDSTESWIASVQVRKQGELRMPVRVAFETEQGDTILREVAGDSTSEEIAVRSSSRVKSAHLDPAGALLEVDRWNNHTPRKVTYHFLIAIPDLDAYQVTVLPTMAVSDLTGLSIGTYLTLWKFPDTDMLRGSMARIGATYAEKPRFWNYSALVKSSLKSVPGPLHGHARVTIWGGDELGVSHGGLSLEIRFGRHLARDPSHIVRCEGSIRNLYRLLDRENYDWTLGTLWQTSFRYSYRNHQVVLSHRYHVQLSLGQVHPRGDRSAGTFDRINCSAGWDYQWTRTIWTRFRVFAGYSGGKVPVEEFYHLRSGAGTLLSWTRILVLPALTPQGHWHTRADGAMRGYIGQTLRGPVCGAINLEQKFPKVPVSVFYDAGNVWKDKQAVTLPSSFLRSDAGLSLTILFLRLDLPVWVSHPRVGEERWAFRASLSVGRNF